MRCCILCFNWDLFGPFFPSPRTPIHARSLILALLNWGWKEEYTTWKQCYPQMLQDFQHSRYLTRGSPVVNANKKNVSISSVQSWVYKVNPYKYGVKILVESTGGGKKVHWILLQIARLTDHPPKWSCTLWKGIVLRIPKSTRPFPWVVWELSNSRSKSIYFIAKIFEGWKNRDLK